MFPDSFQSDRQHARGICHHTLSQYPTSATWKAQQCYRTKEDIQTELREMTRQDIIIQQVTLILWVSLLTYHNKDNGIHRVCLDSEDLNKPIICNHHKAPTSGDNTHRLTASNTYYKSDFKNGFWSIHYTHKCFLLTTFYIHLVRYDFKIYALWFKDVSGCLINGNLSNSRNILEFYASMMMRVYGCWEKEHNVNLLFGSR